MKNNILIVLAAIALAVSCVGCSKSVYTIDSEGGSTTYSWGIGKRHTVTGSGNLVKRTMPSQEYNKVEASNCVNVVFSESADKITISADDNLIDHVRVRFKGSTLVASLDNKINSLRDSHITVTVPAPEELRSTKMYSGASITQVPIFME